jgi:nitrite reductase (NADH) large subunit
MDYLIIGGSAAGISAVEGIRESDKEGKITLVSEESFPVYSRCLLSYYIAGSIPKDKLKFRSDDFFANNKVEALLGCRAEKVDPINKKVLLSGGKELRYDKLLLATGARAKTVDVQGAGKQGVMTLRTVDDADRMLALSGSVRTVVILGAGLVGLKDAYALNARKLQVIVVAKSKQILSQMLDKGAADIVQQHIESRGIKVMLGFDPKEITGGESVNGVILDNGEKIECQMVVVGKGVTPNIGVMEGAGMKTHWGAVVNDRLETSIPGIYAAGDVAETLDIASGVPDINALWPCAIEQGGIAGMNMAGKSVRYEGSLSMNSLEFYGLPLISAGLTKPREEGYDIVTKEDRKNKVYKKLVFRNNRVVGVVLVNAIDKAGIFVTLIKKKIDVSAVKELLLQDNFDFSKIVPLIREQKYNFREEEFQESILS